MTGLIQIGPKVRMGDTASSGFRWHAQVKIYRHDLTKQQQSIKANTPDNNSLRAVAAKNQPPSHWFTADDNPFVVDSGEHGT